MGICCNDEIDLNFIKFNCNKIANEINEPLLNLESLKIYYDLLDKSKINIRPFLDYKFSSRSL